MSEARARLRELLEAGASPPEPLGLLRYVLAAHASDPGADARSTLRALLDWVERARLELALLRSGERWLLLKELVKLPVSTPTEVEALLARAVLTGDIGSALEAIERYALAHPEEAEALILPLADASALLHQVLTPVLNRELIAQRAASATAGDAGAPGSAADVHVPKRGRSSHGVPIALLAGVVFGLLRLGNPGSQAANDFYRGPPATERPASVPQLPAFASVEEACRASSPDCHAAVSVEWALERKDCLGAAHALATLRASPTLGQGSEAASTLSAAITVLDTRVRLCGPPPR